MPEQQVVNLTELVEMIEERVSDLVGALEMSRSAIQKLLETFKPVFDDEVNCRKICSDTRMRSALHQLITNGLETLRDDAEFQVAVQFLNVQFPVLKKFIEVASNEGARVI